MAGLGLAMVIAAATVAAAAVFVLFRAPKEVVSPSEEEVSRTNGRGRLAKQSAQLLGERSIP